MRNCIQIDQGKVSVKVSVFIFKDGKSWIAFCPSLDLSGYATTEKGAKKDFTWMLQDWLNTQISSKSLEQDLKQQDWIVGKGKWSEPDVKELLSKNDLMDFVIDQPRFVKTDVEAVAYCQ